ncbi:hypothetical protein OsI_21893 [Oryza sativa Indica Group]|uniref:SAM domain-containing protein n=1 Tax=Oryza sativa subsp. indica TaxID=39946 RepID=B8B3G8_ORYSI|nr:hypothetical protein OsI_21893 [Oryza sativa Indica Group]
MDWYAWLCRAGLHPDVAFEYARLFARNELAADDLRHLDHGLLATMGVPIAKHRLEILKLARRESPPSSSSSSSLAAVRLPGGGGGGKRTRTTNGAATTYKAAAPAAASAAAAAITGCFAANPDAYSYSDDEFDLYDDGEDMRWESMFQDLKPT